MTFSTTAATKYNPSELRVLSLLEAHCTRFEGPGHYHDPVTLLGLNNSRPTDLNLSGAVFHHVVMISLNDWRNVLLRGATFKADLIISWCTASVVDMEGVTVYGTTDLIGLKKRSFFCKGVDLRGDVYTESRSLRAQIRKEMGDKVFFSQPDRVADVA